MLDNWVQTPNRWYERRDEGQIPVLNDLLTPLRRSYGRLEVGTLLNTAFLCFPWGLFWREGEKQDRRQNPGEA